MRFVLLVVVIFKFTPVFSQINWRTPITLHEQNIAVHELLEIIESKTHVKVSYGRDNIPENIKISIAAYRRPLFEVINEICNKANLSIQVIDNVIVFRYIKLPAVKRPKIAANISDTTETGKIPFDEEIIDLPVPADSAIVQRRDSTHINRATNIIDLKPIVTNHLPQQLVKKRIHVGLFLHYAYDFNYFSFIDREIPEQEFTSGYNSTFGIGTYTRISKRLTLSFGAGLSTKRFTLNYNFKVLDLNDPIPIPDQTKVEITYLEVPLGVCYRVLDYHGYTLSAGTGIAANFRILNDEWTTYQNRDGHATQHFKLSNQRFISGMLLTLSVHKSFRDRWGMYLQPVYCQYLHVINDAVMKSNTRLFTVKAGLFHIIKKP